MYVSPKEWEKRQREKQRIIFLSVFFFGKDRSYKCEQVELTESRVHLEEETNKQTKNEKKDGKDFPAEVEKRNPVNAGPWTVWTKEAMDLFDGTRRRCRWKAGGERWDTSRWWSGRNSARKQVPTQIILSFSSEQVWTKASAKMKLANETQRANWEKRKRRRRRKQKDVAGQVKMQRFEKRNKMRENEHDDNPSVKMDNPLDDSESKKQKKRAKQWERKEFNSLLIVI